MDIKSLIATYISGAFGFVFDALRNPSADRQATLLVLAAIVLAALILALTIAIIVMSLRAKAAEREAWERAAAGEWLDEYSTGEVVEGVEGEWLDEVEAYRVLHQNDSGAWVDPSRVADAPASPVAPPRRKGRLAATLAVLVLVVAAVWVALGYTSSQKQVCASCHQTQPHGDSRLADPHRKIECIECHEAGGPVAASTVNLPSRVVHVIEGSGQGKLSPYGASSTSGCRSCHSAVLDGTLTDRSRGLRMSHAEPLEAGADCLDCHKPNEGLVLAETVGMEPCLRCHDDKIASAACDTCHLDDPATAALGTEPRRVSRAQRLVPDPKCDGCHSTRSCTNCHGVQMPHTVEFKGSGHARAAVIELWKDGGKTCKRCHTETNRPCTNCHEMPFLAHGEGFKDGHKTAGWNASCTCHQLRSPIRGRNFCSTCHSTRPASAGDAKEVAEGAAAGLTAPATP